MGTISDAGNTAAAQANGNIGQTDVTDGNGTSSDEEVYVDDFHEILEEIVLEMADYEEDRDDDQIEQNESDATLTNMNFNEEEQKTADSTQEPNGS